MRHRVKGRHLARTAEHRRALYRNLVAALFEHGRIRTTDAKAREVRPMAEKMITLGKRGDLHARRRAGRLLGDGVALERLFGPIAQRFSERPGGYTRLVKAGRRQGDAAPIAYLELLDEAPRIVRAPTEEEAEEPERKGGRGRGAASTSAEHRGGPKASGASSPGKRAASEGPAAKTGKVGKAAKAGKGGKPADREGSKASRRGRRKGDAD